MLVQCFPASGLVSQSRHIRLVVRKVFINDDRAPAFIRATLFFLPIFLVPLNFYLLIRARNLPVGEVTAILLEIFELIRYGTKASLPEEFVWF